MTLFAQAIEAAVRRLGAKPIAEEFGVSVHTVNRWVTGQSAPSPYVGQVIVGRVADLVQAATES